jgi:GNAT superfamily N-acetyltransferase
MDLTFCNGYLPGCIGRVAELHARYYSRHAGFGAYFESKVAREFSEFCERYDDVRDGLWLVLGDDRVQGSIVIDGSRANDEGAHLRWFIVSDELQGAGLGNRLMTSALDFCRGRNYGRVYLWTFAGLDAARHLYEKHGFRLLRQQRGTQWGSAVSEQCFELRQ